MTAPLPDTPRIEMWFDFASPYSYLAIERIDALARQARVRVELRPFLLGPIFQAQGWNDSPFRLFPGKGAYMMRDIARLAEKYGVVYRRPRLFPRMSVLPARIAILGQDESWGRDFCLAVFRANFQHDLDIQAEDVVHELLTDLSLDADGLIARGKSEAAKEALRRRVDRFLVGTEGSLATVLEATVRLVTDEPGRLLLVLGYPSMAEAADAVPALLAVAPAVQESR